MDQLVFFKKSLNSSAMQGNQSGFGVAIWDIFRWDIAVITTELINFSRS